MAKKKKEEAAAGTPPQGHPRLWTPDQRREAFLKSRAATKEDFHILGADFTEQLIPYGNIVLDHVVGLGGIARHGRVTQVHGDEGAGKTTTALSVAAQYQRVTTEPIGIFEYEPTASANYAWALGVDPALCFFEQPTNLQKAIMRHVELMEKFGVRFFVDDSIPFMETKISYDDMKKGKAFKSNYGGHAKGIATFYKMLRPYLLEYDAALLIVNQTRDRIDEDAENANKFSYTNKVYSLPGGRMARFTPSVMLELLLETELRPWEWEKLPQLDKDKFLLIQPKGDVAKNYPTANKVRVRALKNKVTGAGFREGYIYVRPNFGLDENISIRELACTYGLVGFEAKKWYVGRNAADAIATYPSKTELIEGLVIKEDPEVLGKLRGMVLDAVKSDDSERFKGSLSTEESSFVAEPEGGYKDEEDLSGHFQDDGDPDFSGLK